MKRTRRRSTLAAERPRFEVKKQPRRTRSAVEQAERYLIAHMMKSRAVTEWVKQELGADFQGEVYAALAAYLYRYYQEEKDENVSRFISTLHDPMLKSKASELAMLELPETLHKGELEDYIRQIRKGAMEQKIREQKQLVEQLSTTDPVQAMKIYKEILSIKEQWEGNK